MTLTIRIDCPNSIKTSLLARVGLFLGYMRAYTVCQPGDAPRQQIGFRYAYQSPNRYLEPVWHRHRVPGKIA